MNRLLRKNISGWQLGGYAAAMLVGLVIVLVAVQFYRDVTAGMQSAAPIADSRNIVVSKPVGLSSTLSGRAPSFSPDDIADIESQPWAARVAPFQAADFSVWAGVDFGGRSLSTSLFFESLPDDIVDADPSEWTFDPSRPVIPILISKDYLTLYNMGFATSGRMPVVSEDMFSSIPLTVGLRGNGRVETFPARVVGFSSWLNTVAVPQSFMDWAHDRFGSGAVADPSRLVIRVSDPADPAVQSFIENRGYEVAGPPSDLGRGAYFLKVLTGVIAGVGGIIALLALGILVLSLFLLVQKNRRTINGLLMLGYPVRAIARSYLALVATVNGCVLLLAVACLVAARSLWASPLEAIDMAPAPIFPTVLVAVCLMAAVTFFNATVIFRLVRRCFR